MEVIGLDLMVKYMPKGVRVLGVYVGVYVRFFAYVVMLFFIFAKLWSALMCLILDL